MSASDLAKSVTSGTLAGISGGRSLEATARMLIFLSRSQSGRWVMSEDHDQAQRPATSPRSMATLMPTAT